MKKTWAAGVVVLVLAAAAAGGQPVVVQGEWDWTKDYTPKAPTRWGLAVGKTGEQAYATGRVWSQSSNPALAVWRINSDGSTAWTKVIEPSGSTDCNGVAVAAHSGYVWVTGSVDGANGYDIFTVCYQDNETDATWQWERRYNNGDADGDDVPVGIYYDELDSVIYVGGDSQGVLDSQSSGFDILVLAYGAFSGNDQWAEPARFRGPGGGDDHFADMKPLHHMGAETGNTVGLFVGGTVWNGSTKNDYVVLRLNITPPNDPQTDPALGELTHYAFFNYNGSGHDVLTGLDAYATGETTGAVFVTGYSNGTGTGNNDYMTLAYSLDLATELWSSPSVYDGPGEGSDKAVKAVYFDDGAGGAVFVTGESYGDGTGYDFATIRYAAGNGTEAWTTRFNNTYEDGSDRATDLVVDREGNCYVVGTSYNGSPNVDDIAAISYLPETGDVRWVEFVTMENYFIYNGTANGNDAGAAIRVTATGGSTDPLGEVFLFGRALVASGQSTLHRHCVVKLTQNNAGP